MDILAAFGLSASAGLNAYIPLLVVSLLAKFTNLIDLSEPWVCDGKLVDHRAIDRSLADRILCGQDPCRLIMSMISFRPLFARLPVRSCLPPAQMSLPRFTRCFHWRPVY